jgi:phage major head subunit gpT-like protein
MLKLKDDQGEPYNEGEQKLVVYGPHDLQGVFEELFNASELSSTTNTLKGAGSFVGSQRLSDTNDWYLVSVSGNMKPLIWQKRQAIEFASLEKDSDRGFMSKRFVYGVDYRCGFGYGAWQKAIKVTNS